MGIFKVVIDGREIEADTVVVRYQADWPTLEFAFGEHRVVLRTLEGDGEPLGDTEHIDYDTTINRMIHLGEP